MKNIFLKDSRWGTTLNNTNSYNDHSFLEHYTPAIIIMKLSISQNKYKVQFLSDIAIKIIYCSSTGRRWPLCHFISVKFNKHSYNFPTIPGSWDCSFFPHHNDVGQFVHHHHWVCPSHQLLWVRFNQLVRTIPGLYYNH